MDTNWTEFRKTLKDYVKRESNDVGMIFIYSETGDGYSKVTVSMPNGRKCALMINEQLYNDRKKKYRMTDIDICSMIVQSLKDHYRKDSRRRYAIP